MSDSMKTEPCGDQPVFEADLAELQDLVRILEEGALGLDESIARFERGISLLRRCYQALERAEQRIEMLTGFDRAGNPITAPFDATATIDASNAAPNKRPAKAGRKRPEPNSPEPNAPEPNAMDELSLPEEKGKDVTLF
jgi:exodeoxyribonuclease VII small subunit